MAELIFGKYELLRRLAVGGMGEVFAARQTGIPGFERMVILKSLLPDLAQQPEFVNQFLDEARVAATLNHPHIVSLYEAGLWGGTYFIAMELIDGLNLSQLMKAAFKAGRPMPWQVAMFVVREAALGLDHAHRATDARGSPLKLVHRDISPQNIMVRFDGLTKVVDFGIARAANRVTKTATGSVKGKLMYMSPEQLRGEPMGSQSDQWSLGVVAWELLTGQDLFTRGSDADVIQALLTRPIVDPCIQRPDVPAEVGQMVLRMLRRDPTQRFPSLAEAASAIEGALRDVTGGRERVAEFIASVGATSQITPSDPAANFVLDKDSLQLGKSKSMVVDVMEVESGDITGGTTPERPSNKARPKQLPWVPFVVAGLAVLGGGGWFATRPAPVVAVVQPTLPAPVPEPKVEPTPVPEPVAEVKVDAGAPVAVVEKLPVAKEKAKKKKTGTAVAMNPATVAELAKVTIQGPYDAVAFVDGVRQPGNGLPIAFPTPSGKHTVRLETRSGVVIAEKLVDLKPNQSNVVDFRAP